MLCKLYPFEMCVGTKNMAFDDLLLQSAVNGEAALRFYGWCQPTVSLGYFQKYAEFEQNSLLKSCEVVRRSTGGGAIVHDQELTYSVAIPAGHAGQVGSEPWPCRMHHLIADVLKKTFSVDADAVVCGEEIKRDPFLCFEHHTAGDLAIGPRPNPNLKTENNEDGSFRRFKIIGSAQRKQHNAILQHGSILLARSQFAPGLPGIKELTGQTIPPQKLALAITDAFAKSTGWTMQTTLWTGEKFSQMEIIELERYMNEEWTRKR